jgi:hypothetical protein
MRTLRLFVYAAALALGGCDFMWGVGRSAELHSLPDIKCVDNVIRAAPGVEDVRYELIQPRPINVLGPRNDVDIYEFIYRGASGKISGALSISRDSKGRVYFGQSHHEINRVPDPDVIAATRPVMRHIELALAQECGLVELPGSVKEGCDRVACPTLTRYAPS